MMSRGIASRGMVLGSLLALALPLSAHHAAAATPSSNSHGRTTHTATKPAAGKAAVARVSTGKPSGKSAGKSGYKTAGKRGKNRYAGLQCVPFARSQSGIALKGNAAGWWDQAAGQYARGSLPEPGSVLAFPANASMRLGHIAVVDRVVGARLVEIDHANWAGPGARRGGVSRGIPVVDVSDANDWSAVRVGLGRSGEYGSIYPTYGFIYDRPDTGVMAASRAAPAPAIALNAPPRDLRPYGQRGPVASNFDEVAEAPAAPARTATGQQMLVTYPLPASFEGGAPGSH